eukprot:s1334_g4.t1
MASLQLPLEKFPEEGDPPSEAQDTGRSPSTSVGSSQQSFPGPGAGAQCTEATRAQVPLGAEAPCLFEAEAAWVSQLCDDRAFPAKSTLDPVEPICPELTLPLDFPPVAQTFDDFLSPRQSHAPGSAARPLQSALTLGAAAPPSQPNLSFPLPGMWTHTEPRMPEPVMPVAPDARQDQALPIPEFVPPEPMLHMQGSAPYACAPYMAVPHQPSHMWTPATESSRDLPSLGSASHGTGLCKPCAFHHTKGCQCGVNCTFCHLCLPGEKKRRQKEKQAVARAKTAYGR